MDKNQVKYTDGSDPSMSQKAAVFNHYGKDIHVAPNVAIDDKLEPNNVLIQVYSGSVNPVDWKIRNGDLKMVMNSHFPKITGRDLSGKIFRVGSAVTQFKEGDEVYGMPGGLTGSLAEYVNCHESAIAKKPSNLSWNEAAALPLATLTAYQALVKLGKLTAGQTVLILGGSSGVGHLAVQIAKNIGATVYTTCGTTNIEWVKALGADVVIDYKNEDFVKAVQSHGLVDLVFDAVGQKEDRDKSFDLVKPKGIVVTTTPNDDRNDMGVAEALRTAGDIIWTKISNYISNGVSYHPFFVGDFQGDVLTELNKSIEAGKLRPKIDSVFPLEQIQAAQDKSQNGKLSGKIVIEVRTQ